MNDDCRLDLHALLPHRETMLLLDEVIAVSQQSASAKIEITEQSSFYQPDLQGVPASIALEYMGQTAALIAGYQQQLGLMANHLGFLLGSRRFSATVTSFPLGTSLRVNVEEGALVGDTLANFSCRVSDLASDTILCEATLSVLRQPQPEENQ